MNRNSSEMSFIILPKLQVPPTAYLEHSGQHQVTQSGSKNNFNMKIIYLIMLENL